MDWVNLLTLIKNTSSTNTKNELLFNYLNSADQDEKIFFQAIFDTLLNFKVNSYLSDIEKLQDDFLNTLKNEKLVEYQDSKNFFLNFIYFQITNGYRFKKVEWIERLKHLASHCNSIEELEFYLQIITKRLTIGLSIKGFNKVVENIEDMQPIKEFDCMRVSNINDCEINFSNAYVSIKADGVNTICLDYDKYFSRNGQSIYLPHFEYFYNSLSNEDKDFYNSFVICGELVSSSRQKTSGIVNSSIKLREESKLDIKSLRLHVFDILPKSDFINEYFKEYPFYKRVELIKNFFSRFKDYQNFPFIELEQKSINSKDDVYVLYNEYIQQGYEGVIINDRNNLYENKRSKLRARIKVEAEAEFEIIGHEVHSKKDNWLGSIKVKSSDGLIICNVGSGFKEQERSEFWNEKENLLGKIVKIQFNDVIINNDGSQYSLFLPVFKELRFDKDTADTYQLCLDLIK